MGEAELVRDALAHPVGTPLLYELARGKKDHACDQRSHTGGASSKLTLPILLAELRKGSPDAEITILIATGLHRPTTEGRSSAACSATRSWIRERIVVNNAFKDEDFVKVCDLPAGPNFFCNREAVDCDLLLCEGFIEPHFFAGFSGGRKSILPGICNAATVNENHSYKAIADTHSTTGVLEGNPIHTDMICAARAVNTQFILNVALTGEKVVAAWAGDLEGRTPQGAVHPGEQSQCPSIEGDIVVTSNGGYPLDQNLYQSPKAVATAEACAGEDGVIIMCCSCCEGMGGTNFERLITLGSVDEIDAYLSKIPRRRPSRNSGARRFIPAF